MGPRNHVLDGGPEVLGDLAMSTNFGTQFSITAFVWTIAARRLVMEWGLSGWPTKLRYCRYAATKGRCHGNHFWLSVGYDFGCMIATDMLFDSWGEFWGKAMPWRHRRDRGSDALYDGNHFLAFYIWDSHWHGCHVHIHDAYGWRQFINVTICMSLVIRYWRINSVVIFSKRFYWYTLKLHCVSKNVTTLFHYNSDTRESILKIFGTNVIEKVGNQTVLYFTTSPS